MKNRLSERVAEVTYAFLLAIGNLVGLARLKSTHGKRLNKVESDLVNIPNPANGAAIRILNAGWMRSRAI